MYRPLFIFFIGGDGFEKGKIDICRGINYGSNNCSRAIHGSRCWHVVLLI